MTPIMDTSRLLARTLGPLTSTCLAASLADVEQFLQEAADATDEGVRKLKALAPPDSVKADYDAFLQRLRWWPSRPTTSPGAARHAGHEHGHRGDRRPRRRRRIAPARPQDRIQAVSQRIGVAAAPGGSRARDPDCARESMNRDHLPTANEIGPT